MYRDDAAAARSRIESLEGELKAVQRRIVDNERGERCRDRTHLAAMKRVTALEAKLAKASPRRSDVPPEQIVMELQIEALRAELGDLQLLGRGDEAIQAEIDDCVVEIARVESEIANAQTRRALVAARQTLTVEGEMKRRWRGLRSSVAFIGLLGMTTMVGFGLTVGIGVTVVTLMSLNFFWGKRMRVVVHRDGLELGNVPYGWDELREVRFLPDGDLRIGFRREWLRLRSSHPDFSAAARAVLTEAARLQLPFSGDHLFRIEEHE